MVLSAPSAHDQPPECEARWIRPLRVALRLSKDGVLLLVDHARAERLGELVRALLVHRSHLDVVTDAQFIPRLEPGSTVIFLPKAEEGPFLNEIRPLITQKKLNILVFSDRDTTNALRSSAPDFLDWISNYVECPEGPVAHAVAGLRTAIAANALGIHWAGADDDVAGVWQSISAAFPDETLKWVLPQREYQNKLDEIRAAGTNNTWVGCRTRAETHVRTFRWALAETGRQGRAVLLTHLAAGPGFWLVHNRLLPLSEAAEKLKNAGATYPLGLAAMVDMEPEAVEIACKLLKNGLTHADFVALLAGVEDSGATLAKELDARGGLDEVNALWPPVLRGMPGRFSAAMGMAEQKAPRELPPLGAWIEGRIRGGLDAQGWAEIAEQALRLGDNDAAAAWAVRSIELSGKILPNVGKSWNGLTDKNAGKAGDFVLRAFIQEARRAREYEWVGLAGAAFMAISLSLGLYFLEHDFNVLGRLSIIVAILAGIAYYAMDWRAKRKFRVDVHAMKVDPDSVKLARALDLEHDGVSERFNYPEALKVYLEGNFRRANMLLEGPLSSDELQFLDEHPRYRAALHLLILVVNDEQHSTRIGAYLKKAIVLEGRLVGVSRASFSEIMIELATVQQRKGDVQGAMALLAKPLASERAAEWLRPATNVVPAPLPFDDPEAIEYVRLYVAQPEPTEIVRTEIRVRALRFLAECMISQGRYEEANLIADEARITAEKADAKLELFRAQSIQGRANALAGRYDPDGKMFFQNALARAEEIVGPTHIDPARIMLDLTRMAYRYGDPAAAEWAKRTKFVYTQIENDVLQEECREALTELGRLAE